MRLLSPYALLYLPLVAALILFARRRIPRLRRAVGNLYLWRAALPTDAMHVAVRRTRRDWLIVVQAAVMLSLVAALARPVVPAPDSRALFVVDASASMGARDGDGTRLDRARERARAAARAMAAGARVHLLAPGAAPADRGEFDAHSAALEDALDGLRPAAAAVRIDEALRSARASGPDPIVVFTDARAPAGARLQNVRWEQVGSPADNVAVTALAARRAADAPRRSDLLVEIRNFGSAAVQTEVVVQRVDTAAALATLPVRLDARGIRTVVTRVDAGDAAIRARVAVDDSLAVDNERFALLPSTAPVRVRLLTRGNFFLARALEANPRVALEVVGSGRGADATGADLIVCDGCDVAPEGTAPVLLIPPAAEAAPGTGQPMTRAVADHPLGRFLDLTGAAAVPVRRAESDRAGVVIARAGGLPVVVAYEGTGRRAVHLNVDLSRSALPLSVAFPVLIANAVDWLTRRDVSAIAISAGDPIQEPGVHQVRSGDTERTVVANVDAYAESDLSSPASAGEAAALDAGSPTGPAPPAERPLTTLLLAAAIALFAAEWWLSRRTLTRGALARHAAVAALAAAAIAGPRLPIGDSGIDAVFVVDRSDSISVRARSQALARINAVAETMTAGDRAGVVVFGSDAAVERPRSETLRMAGVNAQITSSGTNIEEALRVARAALPDAGNRRLVLVSDGRETQGDAAREAARAAAAGVAIDVVPAEAAGASPAAIERVVAPDDVRMNEPFTVSVEVTGPPGAAVDVELRRDGGTPATQTATIDADGRAGLAFAETRPERGIHVYRARLAAGGDGPASDAGTAVSVSGPASVLYVAARRATLVPVLGAGGFRVVRVAPDAVPSPAAGLAPYDILVLDDVAAGELTGAQSAAIVEHVARSGAGLLVIGSPASLHPAGYPLTPLGRALPVDFRERSGRRGPSLAMVLAFDKSGSMADRVGGISKIELARQAVLNVLEVLPPTDSLGVIAFDATPSVVTPLGPVSGAADVAARLRKLEPGGSTSIAPAVDLAQRWLEATQAGRRRVLLVSDGRTAPADADRLKAAVGARTFELSVVGIGSDADRELLSGLAASSGGRAYFPEDVRRLPELVARDAVEASGGWMVNESFVPAATSHPLMTGLDGSRLPALAGYVAGAVKPTADAVLRSHLGDPLAAAWRFGLGRVVLFTSDLESPWAAPLRGWTGFGPFWDQAARWASRQPGTPGLRATIETQQTPHIVVDVDDVLAARRASAVIHAPSGETEEIGLRPTAPGRFEGEARTSAPGPYLMTVLVSDDEGRSERRLTTGFYWSAERERRLTGIDRDALAAIATATGGRILSPGDSPFVETRRRAPRDVWPALATLALLTFMADIVARRGLALPRLRRRRRHDVPEPGEAAA